jgi:hypothetical protein
MGIMFLPYAVEDNIEREKKWVKCCLKWKFKYYKQKKEDMLIKKEMANIRKQMQMERKSMEELRKRCF